MNAMETIGMMSTGALVMLGGIYLFAPETLIGAPPVAAVAPMAAPAPAPVAQPAVAAQPAPQLAVAAQPAPQLAVAAQPAPQPATVAQPAPQPATVAQPAPQPVVATATPAPAQEPATTPQVARAQSDLGATASVGQLESFVALALRPAAVDEELTPAQKEIIAYFERTARDLNTTSDNLSGEYVAFNDMAIDRLQIRHFYTVRADMDAVPVGDLMQAQTDLVQGNLCGEPMMRTLVEEHGFSFVYSYVSQDNRFLGRVIGDLSACDA